jgi:hypothetical protein
MTVVGYGNLNAAEVESYTIELRAGITYRFYVENAIPGVDLDIYIADANGNILAGDDSTASDAICIFTPGWSATYIIAIKSASGSSSYRLFID